MPRQHCTNFPEIAQEKSRANIEQKDKIVRNTDSADRNAVLTTDFCFECTDIIRFNFINFSKVRVDFFKKQFLMCF